MLSEEELREIEERALATPGGRRTQQVGWKWPDEDEAASASSALTIQTPDPDAVWNFIVFARDDVLALVGEVRRLQAERS